MPTKPPDPTTPGPLAGAFYWLPAPTTGGSIRWDLLTCHDLGLWDGLSHREFWPSVLAHLAPSWGKAPESLKHQFGDHYHGLPRGRVTRPKGKCLILHGRDAPVSDWKARVIDRFQLAGLRVKAPSSDHERVSRNDIVALEKALGFDLGLLRS